MMTGMVLPGKKTTLYNGRPPNGSSILYHGLIVCQASEIDYSLSSVHVYVLCCLGVLHCIVTSPKKDDAGHV